jgi:hypothetical protein
MRGQLGKVEVVEIVPEYRGSSWCERAIAEKFCKNRVKPYTPSDGEAQLNVTVRKIIAAVPDDDATQDLVRDFFLQLGELDRATLRATHSEEVLERRNQYIEDLRAALCLFRRAKEWVASDSYDGIDDRGRELLEEADVTAMLLLPP